MESLELAEATEVLEPGESTVSELLAKANCEHREALENGVAMVEHAIAAGEALLAVKAKCEPGAWTAWLRDNFEGGFETGYTYMKIAERQTDVRRAGLTSRNAARKYLRWSETALDLRVTPEQKVADVREMHAAGEPIDRIARIFGMNWKTVKCCVDPNFKRLMQQRDRDRRARRNAMKRALREQARAQAIKQAVRKKGGAQAEAYAMAERMQDVLGQAHRETEDRQSREAWSLAGEHYRKMRDEIVRALGVS